MIDKEFEGPVPSVDVLLVEANVTVQTSEEGNYVFKDVAPGRYTVIFSKEGYLRQVKPNVPVMAGKLSELDVTLPGDFTDMEEFVVQELDLGTGTEAGLLQMRLESPALLDSVSADLMSRAGVSDAASALRLVAGASLQNGKSAVIRGLPDRYVSSQMNGVRLPSADEDKRAVELDQFPATVIDSIQVAKTFTPDQQGDASGGAVDVRLKGIPKDNFVFQFKGQIGYNTQVKSRDDFLSYGGGGVNFLGKDRGSRDIQFANLGSNWDGSVGVSTRAAPTDSKWSAAVGGKIDFENGLKIGGLASVFYERDSSFYDDGIDDSYWVEAPGGPMVPRTVQGASTSGDFKTRLFDITRGEASAQWGNLVTFGVEIEDHAINLAYLYSRTTQDVATLAEDTRGKEYFFKGHDPKNPMSPGHEEPDVAPYVRLETLSYTERTTDTLQFHGSHKFPIEQFKVSDLFTFQAPKFDWTVALSSATIDQPDKRQFGSVWFPRREIAGFVVPALHRPFKPAANFSLGNAQRIWKQIEEESQQFSFDLTLPFKQWDGHVGYFKFGYFLDQVDRKFNQDTFSNFNDNTEFEGEFGEYWSAAFPSEEHAITASSFDVDYAGEQRISAWYAMLKLPILKNLSLTGGVRFESTTIGITNDPEEDATWFPPGAIAEVELNPGDGDVQFKQSDVLPAVALEFSPIKDVTLRAAYSQTLARQTFKELSPILQQEFLGGPIFIGNPELKMSSVKNYDLRVDYAPYQGGLVSASFFRKDIKDPIEQVQRIAAFDFSTPVNYPTGRLTGLEFEVRQDLGHFVEALEGLSLGANATFIDSKVKLPADEQEGFNKILTPISARQMTNAPDHLYNLFLTYDAPSIGTQLALFYTVQGDTLLVGAGEANGNFVPDLFAKEFETLNFSLTQRVSEGVKLQFQAKNLTNPRIDTVYRSEHIDGEVRRRSFSRGIDLSLSLNVQLTF